jgi:hypothetical protein
MQDHRILLAILLFLFFLGKERLLVLVEALSLFDQQPARRALRHPALDIAVVKDKPEPHTATLRVLLLLTACERSREPGQEGL